MAFIYLGCVITNYLAFQEFINYPLTYQQVSNAYHEALVYDYDVLKMQAKTGMNYVHVPQAPELIYPHTTKEQILWVNKKDYPEEMCFKLYALDQLPEARPQMRYHDIRWLRGCPLRSGPLHEEICKYINHFDPEELRLKAKVMRVKEDWLLREDVPGRERKDMVCAEGWKGEFCSQKEEEEVHKVVKVEKMFVHSFDDIMTEAERIHLEENMAKLVKEQMDNIDDPGRKTTFEYYPRCDCAKWDCEKKEEKKEEETPTVRCMAIGCPGSEPSN